MALLVADGSTHWITGSDLAAQPVVWIVAFIVAGGALVGGALWLLRRVPPLRQPERCRNCRGALGPVVVRDDPWVWCSEKCRETWVGWLLIQKEG